MKLLRLHLQAFGPFTDRWLDLGDGSVGLHLVYGPNEAGKSTTLRALTALRFGIELRSTDNFVHEHTRMGLGGVFVDASGQAVHLVRRKGRGQTLSLLAPDGTTTPVTDELERQLTGGLTREAWEARFCLDHARLRKGGAALLAGEGDMGTALFEASAGLRSLPMVLQRLDQMARQQFVPGTRGRNGRINEALRQHHEHQSAQRSAVLRPADWGELSRRQDEAAAALQALLARQQTLIARQRQWQELQAVAPLLAALDAARQRWRALEDAPLLDDEAGARRQAALAAQAELQQAQAAEAELIEHKRQALAALPAADQLLQMAAAIDRLAAQADRVDQFRTALVVDTQRLAALEAGVQARAHEIDPAQAVEVVLASLPTPVLLADAQARLSRLEDAERALARQRRVLVELAELSDLADEPAQALPAALSAWHDELRRAIDASAREHHTLARHTALPAEIEAAQRAVAMAMADLGLQDTQVQALAAISPMLDADIDAAIRQADQRTSRLRELTQRARELATTEARDAAERDRLRAKGAVPTASDVIAARQWRDECGQRCFEACLGDKRDQALAREWQARFLLGMRQADALVDAWAQDTARAGRLLALEQGLGQLASSIEQVRAESETLVSSEQDQRVQWAAELARRGLPALPPESLREWQSRLQAARQAAEHAAALAFEAARHQPVAQGLVARLFAALQTLLPWGAERGWWAAAPADWAGWPVPDLLALAREIDAVCMELAQRSAAATGARQARDAQRLREQAEETRCLQAAEQARAALQDLGALLRLPVTLCAAPDAVRARLAEWAQLRLVLDEAARVRAERDRSVVLLDDLAQQAQRLAAALGGEPVGPDLRAWLDRLVGRLSAARQADQVRRLLSQALADLGARQAGREQALQAVQATLAGLCASAGVAGVDELPQAEERARQRLQAQRQCAEVQALLAQASSQDEGALRERVGAQDATRVQNELQACERELGELEPLVEQARQHDEAARRALDAIDSGDAAAHARAGVEQAGAAVRGAIGPWMRARAAHALLQQAMRQFRERAQGPMLLAASSLFATMTGGEFDRLIGDVDDEGGKSVLRLRRREGATIGVEALSEGTRDQLYLALRLAAWQLQRQRGAADLPVALDDVLMTSDDERAVRMLRALADHARGAQVLVFTHHRHLLDMASRTLGAADCAVQTLGMS